jgi:hypothetical protein
MCVLSEDWKRTVNEGKVSHACTVWDSYDIDIQAEVNAYNRRFAGTPGYKNVDWKLFKAMLWVESGGPKNGAWMTRPMQIGNRGDPGYSTLKRQQEGADLIMSAAPKKRLEAESINTPGLNVSAGIAYAFTKLLLSRFDSVYTSSSPVPETYIVQSNDNFDRIAKKVGSTTEVLQKLNSSLKVLHAGDKVLYRKARIERVIVSWRNFTPANLATYYNGGGDACYAQKIEYVLKLLNQP